MKYQRIFLAVAVLALASLACQALTGGKPSTQVAPTNSTQPDATQPQATEPPSSNNNNSSTVSTDFPMTDDAYNVTNIGDGSILYYTKMSQDEVLKFYRDTYTAKGYRERTASTTISAGVFSIVFDGDPSGKAVVIQSVDLGDGSRTVAIRLEDV